jgi:hypothetical protein
MLSSLARPPQLVAQINASRKAVERSYNSLNRSTRWPLGLLDETRQRLNEEKEEKAREKQREVDELGRELRYTQQVVAGELAGWQDMHEKLSRRAIREYARGMIILERSRLDGLRRALRKLNDFPSAQDNNVSEAEAVMNATEARGQTANGTGVITIAPAHDNMSAPSAALENGMVSSSSGGESSAMGASSNIMV